jgi:hypothetical protein
MPGKLDLLGTRYYKVLASGKSLLIAERTESIEVVLSYREIGLVEGWTVVLFSKNLSELNA